MRYLPGTILTIPNTEILHAPFVGTFDPWGLFYLEKAEEEGDSGCSCEAAGTRRKQFSENKNKS